LGTAASRQISSIARSRGTTTRALRSSSSSSALSRARERHRPSAALGRARAQLEDQVP
jgi:hypothetical protein